MAMNKGSNEYADTLGRLFAATPKAVLAAIAVSSLTHGGDFLIELPDCVLREWAVLYANGIVPQRPPTSTTPGQRAKIAPPQEGTR